MSHELVAVVDVGSASTKGGFSGSDLPESVFPSIKGSWEKGTESIEYNLEHSSSKENGSSIIGNSSAQYKSIHPIDRGVVTDWDLLSQFWQTINDEIGITSPDSTSILLVESPRAKASDRAKWAQLIFENYHAPSICFANSSSLCLFASGRTTGLAVDCGAGLSSAVPVFEGLALQHAAICMDYGGQDVTASLRKHLADYGVHLSFNDARIVKENLCFTSNNIPSAQGNSSNPLGKKMSHSAQPVNTEMVLANLPDGTEVQVESRVFSDSTTLLFSQEKISPKGLVAQVHESIKLCDDSIRRQMLQNVVIAGGSSMMKGFGDRLAWDLNTKLLQDPTKNYNSSDLRVTPNSYFRESGYTSQRKHAAWIGGSIFGSLDTFKDLKITRQEWEESADAILQTKCY